jgi:hypothetical protein
LKETKYEFLLGFMQEADCIGVTLWLMRLKKEEMGNCRDEYSPKEMVEQAERSKVLTRTKNLMMRSRTDHEPLAIKQWDVWAP